MFRSPEYCERYEDTPIYLDTPITFPGDGARQKKTDYNFTINDRASFFDWFNGYFEVAFQVNKLADGGNYGDGDKIAMINDAASLISDIRIQQNGKTVYDCNNLHKAVNIKSLIQMSPIYADTVGVNQYFNLDTTASAESDAGDNFNKGFKFRKTVIQGNNKINVMVPLNKYSFFEGLEQHLLPPSQIKITLQLNEDNELIFRAAAADDGRVIVSKLVLWIPKLQLNAVGLEYVMANHMQPGSWRYLREMIQQSASSREREQVFRITAGVRNPKHVFVYLQRTAKSNSQTSNPLLLDTFKINSADNNASLQTARLEVGNGAYYPQTEYSANNKARIYKDVINFAFKQNDVNTAPLINRINFDSLFGMLHFDLSYTKDEITTDPKQITLRFQTNIQATNPYTVYALILYEEEVVIDTIGNELVIV